MKAIYKALALSGLAFAACDDGDYNDWVVVPENPSAEESEMTGVTFSATAADAFDFATLAADANLDSVMVQIFTPDFQSVNGEPSSIDYTVSLGGQEAVQANDFSVSASYLKKAVEDLYGKAPEARTLEAIICARANFDGVKSLSKTTVNFTATLVAPVIEEAYGLVGDGIGWDLTTAVQFERVNPSVSIYDSPEFTITVDAPFVTCADGVTDSVDVDGNKIRKDFYFKIVPQSASEANDWGMCLGAAVNGDESTEANMVNVDPQAFKQPATDGALQYKITINMMEYSIKIEAIAYEEFIFAPGSANGWGFSNALRSPSCDGVYSGYMQIGKEFKFTKHANWDDGEYNTGSFVTFGEPCVANEGTGNIKTSLEADTFVCFMTVDLINKSVTPVMIDQIGIIGDFNSWGGDEVMTYDAAAGTYTATVTFASSTTFKFRANGGWDINLGGSLDALTAGGDNIAAEAGTYKVTLYPFMSADQKAPKATLEPAE